MRNHSLTRISALGGLLAVSLGIGGAAAAQNITGPTQQETASYRQVAEVPTASSSTAIWVERQQGIVLEGFGQADGLSVMATVYENSLYGNSIQIVIGDPEDDTIGYTEQSQPFVVDGTLQASVDVAGETATIAGTIAETGTPERIIESTQDGDAQIVTRGTHTQLLADVSVSYQGVEVPLEFAPAFGYELEVRRVTLYGN